METIKLNNEYKSKLTSILIAMPIAKTLLVNASKEGDEDFFLDLLFELGIKIFEKAGYSKDDYHRVKEIFFYRASVEMDEKDAEELQNKNLTPEMKKMAAALALLSGTNIPGYFTEEVRNSSGKLEVKDLFAYKIICAIEKWTYPFKKDIYTNNDLDEAFSELGDRMREVIPEELLNACLVEVFSDLSRSIQGPTNDIQHEITEAKKRVIEATKEEDDEDDDFIVYFRDHVVDISGSKIEKHLDEDLVVLLRQFYSIANNLEYELCERPPEFYEILEKIKILNDDIGTLLYRAINADMDEMGLDGIKYLKKIVEYDGKLFFRVKREDNGKFVYRAVENGKYYEFNSDENDNNNNPVVNEIEGLTDKIYMPDSVDLIHNEKWPSSGVSLSTLETLQKIAITLKFKLKDLKTIMKSLKKKNHILADIVEQHLNYNNGDINPNPIVIDGCVFFEVGRNSSHWFYLGTDGTKIFRYADGEGEDYGQDPATRKIEITDLNNVYLGHY